MRTTDIDDLRSVVRDGAPRPVFLLGAGASATSGVPLVWQLVDLIGRYAYCRKHGRDIDDPTLMRSDWYPWVSSHEWFDPAVELQELYARHIKELLEPRERRRQFLQEYVVVNPDRASSGYRAMASLVGKRRIHSILTPNFETLIYDSCRRDPSSSSIIQIQSPAQGALITTDPAVGQVIHVHGVIEHYADLNLTEEVAHLDPTYASQIIPLIADHPLIVIGYRGAEPSVYRDLLLAAASRGPVPLPHGVFWCTRPRDGDLHPNVIELGKICGGNFALVEIDGFDEVMSALDQGVSRVSPSRPPEVLPFDGRVVSKPTGVDSDLVEEVLSDGALDRLALSMPAHSSRSDVDRLRLMGLLTALDGGERLTNAARILFSDDCPIAATVEVGGVVRTVEGNLFQVYRRLTELIAEENEPYRIKGPESFDVRPYPPMAVKELVVNALVHRDYEIDEVIEVSIDSTRLRIRSPGGLVEPSYLEDLGERSVRQYRNPSVAEVLYSAGLMDKYGSGLMDVSRWAREGGAVATFETGPYNGFFEAVITSRADSVPGTPIVGSAGAYEVFYLNALPLRVPDQVWIGSTPARRPRDIFDRHPGESVPRFALDGTTLYTFSDLTDRLNPLHRHVESPELHGIDEVCASQSGEAHVLELLNRIFERHMQDDAIEVHHKKGRIWYHANPNGSDREITYQARVRTATRTVVHKRGSTSRRPYYEHQAFNWSILHIQDDWLLTIDPTWVFTSDGRSKLETRRRTTQLATKKMGNERNQTVLNNVFFWSWAICGNADLSLIDADGIWIERRPLRRDETCMAPTRGPGEDDDPDSVDLEDYDGDPGPLDEDVDIYYDGVDDA